MGSDSFHKSNNARKEFDMKKANYLRTIFLICLCLISFYQMNHNNNNDNINNSNNNDKLYHNRIRINNNYNHRILNTNNFLLQEESSSGSSRKNNNNDKNSPPSHRLNQKQNNFINNIQQQQQYNNLIKNQNNNNNNDNDNNKKLLPPLSIKEKIIIFENFANLLHHTYKMGRDTYTAMDLWNIYHQMATEHLVFIDRDHEKFEVVVKNDNDNDNDDETIFVSVASYRDENCPTTLKNLYKTADQPDKIYIGLVQQNCYEDCVDGNHTTVLPDIDCYHTFCGTEIGKPICGNNQIRILRINEAESLGPANARYFASHLWNGETYFMQIDAHITTVKSWDTDLKKMYSIAPAKKLVITNYSPSLIEKGWPNTTGRRICDAKFDKTGILIMENSSEFAKIDTPRYASYIAGGFFFTHGEFVREVPFDPILPWVFMGEEILLSIRAFTNGWDIFGPSKNIMGHMYSRRAPKFIDNIVRVMKADGYIQLTNLLRQRVRHICQYPEAEDILIHPPTLIESVDLYGLGNERPYQDFYDMVGINIVTKRHIEHGTKWCLDGEIPRQVLKYMNFKTAV